MELFRKKTKTANYCTDAENRMPAGETLQAPAWYKGVYRYDSRGAMEDLTEKPDLSGFNTTYWTTTSGSPVWNQKA